MKKVELLDELRRAHRDTAIALHRAVGREFPVGRVVMARLRREWSPARLRVIGHGYVWTNPEEVVVENVDTGGRHRVPYMALAQGAADQPADSEGAS